MNDDGDVQGRRSRIVALMAEICETDAAGIRGDQRLREDLGMDSLASLELLSRIGEELAIDLAMEDAMEISTVDDACALVEKSRREQRASAA